MLAHTSGRRPGWAASARSAKPKDACRAIDVCARTSTLRRAVVCVCGGGVAPALAARSCSRA
eukprot:1726548-Prymnesium_polylepis.1